MQERALLGEKRSLIRPECVQGHGARLAAMRPQLAGYGVAMGPMRGSFSLSNPTRPDLASIEVSALVDSGAVHLCIPEHLAIQLSLAELERREVILADGHRRCFTGAMVLGNEVLLGSIPMEDMDLVLRPQLQSVDVNPESPNIPLSVAKGLQQA